MTGTPAERAAVLSARIHREINAGRFGLNPPMDTTERVTGYLVRYKDGHCAGCALGAAAVALGIGLNNGVFTFTMPLLGADAVAAIETGFEQYDRPGVCADDPFYRLGAELRAIVLGNREGRR